MNAPLSRISLLLAIVLLVASLFQKSIANAMGNPLVEPTQLEQVMKGGLAALGNSPILEVPKHPVTGTIFWIGLGIAALSLWAWIVEDSFWIPLVALSIALIAAMLKMALIPAVLAAIKAGNTTVKKRSSTRRSSAASTTSNRSSSSPSRR